MHFVVVAAFAAEALVIGQSADVNKILADMRAALGGEAKLATVKSLTATGRTSRVTGDTSSAPADFEMALEWPDKFVKKDTLAVIMDTVITRTSGFNGDGLIEAVDTPPQMGHGGMVIRQIGPGGSASFGGGNAPASPEQIAATRKAGLLANKQESARLTLGMFGASLGAYPVQFSYDGQADSPDGKADVLDVKGDGDFAVRFFVDAQTHLPLMLTWMAKEPLTMNTMSRPGGVQAGSSGNAMTILGGANGMTMTPEERDKMMKDFDENMKQAEANRKLVEYRVYYGDYRTVDGVKVPFRIQRSVGGKPTEELVLDKIRFNAKIDPKKFETVK
jgi:hypothetical protein